LKEEDAKYMDGKIVIVKNWLQGVCRQTRILEGRRPDLMCSFGSFFAWRRDREELDFCRQTKNLEVEGLI
jgi:hypothetical protein